MIVMAFDLSSVCIGVITARVNGKRVEKILSCPIIPPKYNPTVDGYLKSKKKIVTSKGKEISCYVKQGETTISIAQKRQRDSEIRKKKDLFVMLNIAGTMGNMTDSIKPDLILVEKNAIFNGVLTSVLLGKVMGVLLGLAGRASIPVKEYTVAEVRKKHNVPKLVLEFVKGKTEEELRAIPDKTKRALRVLMEEKYNFVCQTDDESDAAVVFDHWFTGEVESDDSL